MSRAWLLLLWAMPSVLSTVLIPLTNIDLDERYFYYLATAEDSNKALLCKGQSEEEYVNEICPLGHDTRADEPNFKFYVKIFKQENLVMLFNKAITIRSVEQTDQKLPWLEILLKTPTCHFNQIFHLFMSMGEDLRVVEDDGRIHWPYILLGTEFCKQAFHNKNSCILQLMNNTAQFAKVDERFYCSHMLSENFFYLLQTPESNLRVILKMEKNAT